MEKAKRAISAVIGYRLETQDGGIFLNAEEVEAVGHFLMTGKRVQVKEEAPARPAIRRPAAALPARPAASMPAPRPAASPPAKKDELAHLEDAARKAAIGEGPAKKPGGGDAADKLEEMAMKLAREMAV